MSPHIIGVVQKAESRSSSLKEHMSIIPSPGSIRMSRASMATMRWMDGGALPKKSMRLVDEFSRNFGTSEWWFREGSS